MNELDLNLRLKQEMESLAPNRLEELLASLDAQTPVQPNIEPMPKPRRLPRLIAAAAAVVLLASGLFYGVKDTQRSVVTLDAGASVTMTVNGFQRVKRATLRGLETDSALKGMRLDDAAEEIARCLVEENCLGSESNGVLVTVKDAGDGMAAKIGAAVAEGISRAAENDDFRPAVLLCRRTGDTSDLIVLSQAAADRCGGIDLLDVGDVSLEDLLRAIGSHNPVQAGGARQSWRWLSAQDAEEIAAALIGPDADPTGFITRLTVYDDAPAYSVAFPSDSGEWTEYRVSAANGEIMNDVPPLVPSDHGVLTAPAAPEVPAETEEPVSEATPESMPEPTQSVGDSFREFRDFIDYLDDLF